MKGKNIFGLHYGKFMGGTQTSAACLVFLLNLISNSFLCEGTYLLHGHVGTGV